MAIKRHPLSRIALLRAKHRTLRQRKYQPMQRMSPRISTSIWSTPTMHSFSHPLSPINKEYNEPEERSERKEMNWAQAKRAFPKLSPFGDVDKDGIYNMFDCKPFDRKRQGPEHKHMSAQQLIDEDEKFTFNPTLTDNENDDIAEAMMERNRSRAQEKLFNQRRVSEEEFREAMDEDMKNDQLGWNAGEGSKKASKNITKITKKYKNIPF